MVKKGVPDKSADCYSPVGYSGLNVLIQETTNRTTLFQSRSFNHPIEKGDLYNLQFVTRQLTNTII